MHKPFRDRRTPADFAARGQVIEINEKIAGLKRLSEVIRSDFGTLDAGKLPRGFGERPVIGHLVFGYADAGERLPAVEGNVETVIDAVCQRCLEPFELPLAADFRLLLSNNAEMAEAEAEGFEVWELEEATIRPVDLVEELLIMALPFSARHEDPGQCRPVAPEPDEDDGTLRPFADLRKRLRDGD